MERGTPFALAHTFRQTGPFRPRNVDPSCARPRVRRLLDRARCRGPHGPRLRQAGGGAGAPPGSWACIVITLEASYAECKRLNKRYGTTYYWSTMLLPSVKRPHVHALYGFCRHADDIVDDGSVTSASSAGAPRSPSLRDRFFIDLDRGHSDDLVLKAVVHTVRAFDIDPDGFARFLRSMEMDLTVERYETWEDLREYMDGSAAVIGEMMLPILEPTDLSAATGPARALGEAFQLTNFLRDVDEDLDRGRQYLPQEDLRRFGVDLAARRCTPSFVELMRFEIARCRRALPLCRGRHRPASGPLGSLHPCSARPVRADPRSHRGAGLRRVRRPGPRFDAAQARRRRSPPHRTGSGLNGSTRWSAVATVAAGVAATGMIATPLARRGRHVAAAVGQPRGRWAGSHDDRPPRPRRWGTSRAAAAAGVVVGCALAVERAGTATGVPFGRYRYTGRLRPTVARRPRGGTAGVVGDGPPGTRGRPRRAWSADDTGAAHGRRRGRHDGVGPVPRSADDGRALLALGTAGQLPRDPALQLRRLADDERWDHGGVGAAAAAISR